MTETDLTPEEAAADARLPLYNVGDYDPVSNPYGFDNDGHQVNQMRQARDAGVMGRLARRLALFVQGLANTVAANVLLTAEDAENTRLDRIATAENVVRAAEEVTKAAAQAERLVGTSATNVTSGVGSRTFTTQAGKYFAVGTFLTIVSTAAPTTRWMAGQVTAYNATTGALTVNVEAIGATTSAAASWSIYLGGPRGAQGIQGIPGFATMPYRARSSNTQIVAGDSAALFDLTGTFTQTFAAPATLGANWYAFIKNAGTGQITIPVSDGRTDWIMYPGEMRLFQCDGTTLRSEVLWPFTATFTVSGNFVLPPGYSSIEGLLWGAGGGGGSAGAGTGGSGGGCGPIFLRTSELATTTAFTIGAGGLVGPSGGDGGNGGSSSFGPLTVNGGGGGAASSNGPGGNGGGVSGAPIGSAFGGVAAVGGANAPNGGYGGGAGGPTSGGRAIFGGAGGSRTNSGGSSTFGGNGGVGNTPGMAPGGGGGAGADGARGELRLWGVA